MRINSIFYIFTIFLFSLFFISCGDNNSEQVILSSPNNTKYMSIAKAPASDSVSIFQNLSLEFSAELNSSSVNSASTYITDAKGELFGSEVEVDELNSSKITFTPHMYFSPASEYTIVITTAVKDTIGRSLSKNFYHTFTTQVEDIDTTALYIKSTKPSNNKTDIDPSSDFYIEFNRFISQGNVVGDAILELKDSNGNTVDGVSKVFNSTLSFIPSNDLNTTQSYTLTLLNSVSDMFGNIYDPDANTSSWSFTTSDPGSSYNKAGISRISEIDIARSSYVVKTLKQSSTDSIIALGTIGGIELYKISYILPFTKPLISLLYSYDLPSKVNDILTYNENIIIVSTTNNGIYSFSANESNLSEIRHLNLSEPLYTLSLGKDINGTVDRLYGVGPKHGLSIYSFSQDGTFESLSNVEMNSSIMVDVTDAIGYDYEIEQEKRRIYVADYNNAILIYDENGSLEKKVDLNASVRKIMPVVYYDGYVEGIAGFSSSGLVNMFDLNGSATGFGDIELPIKVSNAINFTDQYNSLSKTFVSDKDRGIVSLESSSSYYPESVILYDEGVISSTIVSDTNQNIDYIVGVSENGKLGLYNIYPDTSPPQVISASVTTNGVIEANASISMSIQDDRLDFATLSSGFELIDLNTSQNLALDINISGQYDTAVCTLTPEVELEDKDYKLVLKGSIKDIVGNALNGGVDTSITFSAHTEPIEMLLDDIVTGVEDANITGNVLDNDIGNDLEVLTFDIGSDINVSAGTTVNSSGMYEFTLYSDGSYLFQPIYPNLNGTIVVKYRTTSSLDANLTINIPNDNNDAFPDTAATDYNITIDLFANDEPNVSSISYAQASGGNLNSIPYGDTTVILGVGDGNITLANGGDGSITFTYIGDGVFNILNQDYSDNNITITYTTNTGSVSTASVPLLAGGGQVTP